MTSIYLSYIFVPFHYTVPDTDREWRGHGRGRGRGHGGGHLVFQAEMLNITFLKELLNT